MAKAYVSCERGYVRAEIDLDTHEVILIEAYEVVDGVERELPRLSVKIVEPAEA